MEQGEIAHTLVEFQRESFDHRIHVVTVQFAEQAPDQANAK